jgi:hypothetical protein
LRDLDLLDLHSGGGHLLGSSERLEVGQQLIDREDLGRGGK